MIRFCLSYQSSCKMMKTVLFAIAVVAISSAASAQNRVLSVAPVVTAPTAVIESEAAVRAMPLHERPNRLGHFYGNTIRRRHHGTLNVNRMHSDRPIARYLYIAR